MIETVLFGRRNTDEAWAETVLCTQPERFAAVSLLAKLDGWGHFRVAEIDLSKPPDFAKTVRQGERSRRGRWRGKGRMGGGK